MLDNPKLHGKWWVWAATFWDMHVTSIPEGGTEN